MRWMKRLSLVAGSLVLIALAIVVGGSLVSLDWDRKHAARTAALPLLAPGQPDGLVRIEANGMIFRAIKVFTAPFVPEMLLSFNGMANLRGSYPNSTPEQREEYLAVFSEPGALTGALNWYRAITTSLEGAETIAGPVEVPTLFVWGEREGWVNDEALRRQREFVTGPYAELEVDAAHFVMQQQPDEVVAAVLAHLRGAAPR